MVATYNSGAEPPGYVQIHTVYREIFVAKIFSQMLLKTKLYKYMEKADKLL